MSPRRSDDGSWFNHKVNMLRVAASSDTGATERLLRHELAHFGLHVASPYGYVLDDLHQLQTEMVIGYCSRFLVDLEGEKIPFPVWPFSRDYGSDLDKLEQHFPRLGVASSLVHWFVRPWSLLVFLERILEGDDASSVLHASDSDAIETLVTYERARCEGDVAWPMRAEALCLDELVEHAPSVIGVCDVRSAESILGQSIPACPRQERQNDKPAPIGARQIFENHAQQIERAGGDKTARMLASSDGLMYFNLWAQLLQALGLNSIRSKEDYERVRLTLFALCDVALLTPIGPLYRQLRTSGTMWIDIHPGIRFSRALDVGVRLGVVSDVGRDYLAFQDAICDELRWPRPNEFLRIGATLRPTSPQNKRHREACRLKLAKPTALVVDVTDDEEFFLSHAPMMWSSTHGGAHGGADVVGNLLRRYMTELTWGIMTSSGDPWREAFASDAEWPMGVSTSRVEFVDYCLQAFPAFSKSNFVRCGSVS